jgi:hypothetical protein
MVNYQAPGPLVAGPAPTCTNSDTCPTAAATKPTMSSPADVACTEARHSHLHSHNQGCCSEWQAHAWS